MPTKENMLLPSGFYDLLPAEAENGWRVLSTLVERMRLFGYDYVSPPLMEFEETLSGNAGSALARQSFRVLDPVSNRMMALRADITPQISRMVASRFEEAERPLRLCYGGQVARIRGEGLFGDRELTQAGLELIGNASAATDAEPLLVACEALELLGISGMTVDFGLPSLFRELAGEAGGDAGDRARLEQAVRHKNVADIDGFSLKNKALWREILPLAGAFDVVRRSVLKLPLPSQSKASLKHLETVAGALNTYAPSLEITLDPLGSAGFDYYDQFSFGIFAKGGREQLARGGHYRNGYTMEPAVGLSFDANAIQRHLTRAARIAPQAVSGERAIKDSRRLRDQGTRTRLILE